MQDAARRSVDRELARVVDAIWRTPTGAGWNAPNSEEVQLRLLIVTHFGDVVRGDSAVTLQVIHECFWWFGFRDGMKFICEPSSSLCKRWGWNSVLRPLGEEPHAEKLNALIYFEYLYINPSVDNLTYLLVVKDDASHYQLSYPCTATDTDSAFDCVMDRFATFGVLQMCVSEQGTHCKSGPMYQLQRS